MSYRKPNLHIQIDQLGDQYNSKFQGYVNYTEENEHEPYYEPNDNSIYHSKASNHSFHSHRSNISNRSSLLQRASQLMMENKLTQNLKSLSRSRLKNSNNSRSNKMSRDIQQSDVAQKNRKKVEIVPFQRQLSRSKSAMAVTRQNSRAKILQEIADKLKKVSNRYQNQLQYQSSNEESNLRYNINFKADEIKNSPLMNQVENTHQKHNNYHNRINSPESENQNKSTVQKIKQFKQKLTKNRGGKLQHLMKDIKKSNKQVYKVVYTIKKSGKNTQNNDVNFCSIDNFSSNIQGNNIYIDHDIVKQAKSNSKMKKIAEQLVHVRKQLKQVKIKNQQLLKLSAMRSASASRLKNSHNDNASQSSRITRQIQALQMDDLSNASQYYLKNSPRAINRPPALYVPLVQNEKRHMAFYNQPVNNLNDHQFHNGYIVVQPPEFVQQCFACGCTCRGRLNKLQ